MDSLGKEVSVQATQLYPAWSAGAREARVQSPVAPKKATVGLLFILGLVL